MKKMLLTLLLGATPFYAQAPQIPITGTLGAGGSFPAICSTTVTFPSDANYTPTYPAMACSSGVMVVKGSLTATRNLVLPLTQGFNWKVENLTTGGQSIQVIGASGTGITIANGTASSVMADGTNYVQTGGSGSSGVTQIIAGSNVTISPSGGTGTVTVNASGGSGGPCPLTNSTNLCLTAAPYYASPDGTITTTTTTTVSSGATTVPVASCSTFSAGQGVLVTGSTINTVASCTGTTLTLTSGISAGVSSGVTVQHDETAAFQAALTALNAGATHSGTIWIPGLAANGSTAYYLINGPLQNTGTANAIVQLPSVPNYGSQIDVISIQGYNEPSQSTVGMGPVIYTSQNAGNLFGGYDGASGGGYPPLTAVNFSMKNLVIQGPTNPSICLLNFGNLYSFQGEHLLIRTAAATLPSSTSGCGLIMPLILNNVENQLDDLTIAGFAVNAQLTEHTHVGHLSSQASIEGIVFDTGHNSAAPGTYDGNSISVDYLWGGFNTCGISGGANSTAVNIQNYDSELNTTAICDPSNYMRGYVAFENSYSTNALTMTGGSNLTIFNLWTNNYVTSVNFGSSSLPLSAVNVQNNSSGGTHPPLNIEDDTTVSGTGSAVGFGVIAPHITTGQTVHNLWGHDLSTGNNGVRSSFVYEASGSTSNYWWQGMHEPGTGGPPGICGNATQIGIGFTELANCPTTNTLTINGSESVGDLTVTGTCTGCGSGSGIPTTPTNALVKINGSNGAASGLVDSGTSLAYAPTSGTNTAYEALVGNVTTPSAISNSVGWMAPSSASFTAYALQLPTTNPSSGDPVLNCGTPTSGVSACTWAAVGGSSPVFYWNVPTGVFATTTMLSAVYPIQATTSGTINLVVRLEGAITCSVAPQVQVMDLGTSATTAYGSATGLIALSTGTSDGVFTDTTAEAPITGGHYIGLAFEAGTCTTPPTVDVTAQIY